MNEPVFNKVYFESDTLEFIRIFGTDILLNKEDMSEKDWLYLLKLTEVDSE